ncbi:PaaI family thioesterase [Pseudonocardia abyssalis]|uniref:PaaI family thioesterase n=1 Tax=Pseudonocardia abyssalis TaxID=2792008 RepID=A0ABS6UNS6_9PSEU|nr:PaaI family thioesterase [Pseudonocardia abyssalis]MBW0117347.1 PaaI family thioesterase [Pseudonocardia abyssalis]MBW0133864.1 PaaI family thioesterase [Pseudonocardia abyssalis]
MTRTIPLPSGFAQPFADAVTGDAPDFEGLRAVADALVPFGNHAGITITEIGPDRAVAEIPDQPHLTNHMATVHAGALFLAADIAGASAFVGAAADVLSRIDLLVLRDARSTFRRPAIGRVRAVATVDDRDMARVRATDAGGRVEVDGRAHLYDDADVLVAKFTFDYVCTVLALSTTAPPSNAPTPIAGS